MKKMILVALMSMVVAVTAQAQVEEATDQLRRSLSGLFDKEAEALRPDSVTPDGEWHETGRMGWWGMDDATAESREAFRESFEAFLKEAQKQNLLITIVDCHI